MTVLYCTSCYRTEILSVVLNILFLFSILQSKYFIFCFHFPGNHHVLSLLLKSNFLNDIDIHSISIIDINRRASGAIYNEVGTSDVLV